MNRLEDILERQESSETDITCGMDCDMFVGSLLMENHGGETCFAACCVTIRTI
jgi:hypothetical protein